ncbi:unnamed protein product [Polarella glacialis]|uniref:Uncharacterized protein n=2 Tax=Polarella glacialis TaxID=89957 RepID=A0A813LA29_POLGL|nr:unnamed protein product [Polarella glacialis]
MASSLEKLSNDARRLRIVLRILLVTGGLLSVVWMAFQIWLTNIAQTDSQLINHAGRLRAQTQNIGLVFLSSKYLNATGTEFHLNPEIDSFDRVRVISSGLLGSVEGGEIPELLDDPVKDRLREWLKRVQWLESMRPRLQSLSTEEMAALTLEVNSVTRAMDLVVQEASVFAQSRVQTLLLINIFRALTAVIWGLATMFIAGKLWIATETLVLLTAQHGSLLKSSYDAVIQVSAKSPFEVFQASAQLDHMIGQSMAGQSILKYVPDAGEKAKLEDFLGSWRSPKQPGYSRCVTEVCTSCWRVASLAKDTFQPSAARVLHSVWHCTLPDGSQRASQMELSLASFLDPSGHHLLAVRQVGGDPGGDPGTVPDPGVFFRQFTRDSSSGGSNSLQLPLPQVTVFSTFSPPDGHGDVRLPICSSDASQCGLSVLTGDYHRDAPGPGSITSLAEISIESESGPPDMPQAMVFHTLSAGNLSMTATDNTPMSFLSVGFGRFQAQSIPSPTSSAGVPDPIVLPRKNDYDTSSPDEIDSGISM